MLTETAARKLAEARWLPHPDVQAALDYVAKLFTAPETDGMSKLERIYRTCQYENQRNNQLEAGALAILGKRFKGEYISFQADCPDDGRCRMHLRVGRTHAELAQTPPAHTSYFLNLLKPLEEWIVPPKPGDKPVTKRARR